MVTSSPDNGWMQHGVDLHDGWELRDWCGERGTDHEMDLDKLIGTMAVTDPDVAVQCTRCGHTIYTVVDAEQREHLLNKMVTIERFTILEEEF